MAKPNLTFRECASRAFSTLRYWNYRRKRPNPLSLRWALSECVRRFLFEWRVNR